MKQTELWDIEQLKQWDKNPRSIHDIDFERLKIQLSTLKQHSPLLVMADGTVIGGNMRLKAMRELDIKNVKVEIIDFIEEDGAWYAVVDGQTNYDRTFTTKEEGMFEYSLSHNDRAGFYDKDKLSAILPDVNIDLSTFSVDLGAPLTLEEFNNLSDAKQKGEESKGSLRKEFLAPPFSVLDGKHESWLERKRTWMGLGIQSEIGRESNLVFSTSSQPGHVYELKNAYDKQIGKKSSWEEFIKTHPDIQLMNGTSIFDPVLTELCYRWFCPTGGIIVDPFAGGSVRGIVAGCSGYQYYGMDLSEKQIIANREQAESIFSEPTSAYKKPVWKIGDSLTIDTAFSDIQADLIFTCPPYADLEKYSDDPADLSNMDYLQFQKVYTEIIKKSVSLLKDDRFAIFVVGEVRGDDGFYYHFVEDTKRAFEDAGARFYNDMVLLTPFGSAVMTCRRAFMSARKIKKVHQNVLVFYKGNPKHIPQYFKEVQIADLSETEETTETE